jgi:hypothetical protein
MGKGQTHRNGSLAMIYSQRRTTGGSTRVARRAGSRQPEVPTSTTSVTTAAIVHGSVREAPQIGLARNRAVP